jgi:isopenicillin N synthase-like dioxygenase
MTSTTSTASPPPVIDVSSLVRDPHTADAEICVEAIHAACVETGFFVVVGHGLEAEMARLLDAARAFFALPQVEKERVPRVDRYGFVPHMSAALDPGRASDTIEYIDIGLANEVALLDLAGLEAAVRTYQRAALVTAGTVLRALAAALGAEPGFFSARMVAPQCRLRLIRYPAGPPGAAGVRRPVLNAPHTDYGAITLLASDGTPGLEVKPLDGAWTPVESPPAGLVVNLGDMLARWTNDRYRSTPHRVVGWPGRDRISIPFFVNPDPSTVVDCIPSCVTVDRPCRYEPVTAGEFLASRIDGSTEPYIDPEEGPTRISPVSR